MRGRGTAGGGRRERPASELDLFVDPSAGRVGERAPDGRVPARAPRPEPLFPGESARSAISVDALTRAARDVLEGAFLPLWVRGEVSDFKAHRSGHWYFCLRDAVAQVRCVVWSRDQFRIPAPPDDGMQIVAHGQLTLYPTRGDVQLVVTRMEAEGDGLRRKALERTIVRLRDDGLLAPERKRAIPRFARRIAVITSLDGAALRDVIAVVRRRCPVADVVVVAARVQGDGAPQELIGALDRLARWGGADVVIIGRGGGAREDLSAFNDERVARTLAGCPVPTISAVGHEVDTTICDLVADLRAATPSAAAEAAVPVLDDVYRALAASRSRLRATLERRAIRARHRLEHGGRDLHLAGERVVERRRRNMESLAARLHALSPLATLARGYAIATAADGRTLSNASDFAAGDPFRLTLRDGSVDAITRDAHPAGE